MIPHPAGKSTPGFFKATEERLSGYQDIRTQDIRTSADQAT
jgi:hypothetical protein